MIAPILLGLAIGTLTVGIGAAVHLGRWQARAARAAFPTITGPPWLDQLERRFVTSRYGRRVQRQLQQVDWRLPAVYWTAIWLISWLVAGVLLHWMLTIGWFVAWSFAVSLSVSAAQYVRTKLRGNFIKVLANALPEATRLVANGMQAGLGIRDALWVAATELPEPMASIFGRPVSELDMGTPLGEVLLRLDERYKCRELTILCRTVLLHGRLGGHTAKALHNLSEILAERAEVADEVAEQLTEVRIGAVLLPLMPVGLALVLNLMMPGFLAPLSTGPGLIILGAFIILEVLLYLLCRAIASIPV